MVYQRKRDYEYREGWRPTVDANTVGGVIEEIEEKNGVVTSELFLEASRSVESPTHGVFEWNDGTAAEKYRLYQASKTICAIRVVIKEEADIETPRKPPRAFVNIAREDDKKAKYVNVQDAMLDENTREVVLARAIRELKAFREKYEELSELSEVFSAISNISDKCRAKNS